MNKTKLCRSHFRYISLSIVLISILGISCGKKNSITPKAGLMLWLKNIHWGTNKPNYADFKPPLSIDDINITDTMHFTARHGIKFSYLKEEYPPENLYAYIYNADDSEELSVTYYCQQKQLYEYILRLRRKNEKTSSTHQVHSYAIGRSSATHFSTENGLHLGMSKKQVINILGEPFKIYHHQSKASGNMAYEYMLWDEKIPLSLRKYSYLRVYSLFVKFHLYHVSYIQIAVAQHLYPYDYP